MGKNSDVSDCGCCGDGVVPCGREWDITIHWQVWRIESGDPCSGPTIASGTKQMRAVLYAGLTNFPRLGIPGDGGTIFTEDFAIVCCSGSACGDAGPGYMLLGISNSSLQPSPDGLAMSCQAYQAGWEVYFLEVWLDAALI